MGTSGTGMAAKRNGQPKSPHPVAPELRAALATNLRTARLAVGLTQTQLGDLADVCRDYIRRIEARDANVSIDVLAAIAHHVTSCR
jgi:predicted transcriptional regulator